MGDGQMLAGMIDPKFKLSLDEWLDRIEDIALDHGDFDPLGPDHSALLIRNGANLLVTFELVDEVRSQPNVDVPLAWVVGENNGWSHLCILGHKDTWFRHRAIYEHFDRLIDDGFFDEFDNVLFYGSENCGYAAGAYSVAAPGANVVLISPQATLDPRHAEWDPRFPSAKRMDFTSRYGFAPRMVEGCEKVHVFYDPLETQDAMHAALFHSENVTKVRCTHFDNQIEMFLRRMNVLEGLLLFAMRGRLTDKVIATALRERRNYLPYLRRLLMNVEQQGRPFLTAIMCRQSDPSNV